jgi:hypothetical protein
VQEATKENLSQQLILEKETSQLGRQVRKEIRTLLLAKSRSLDLEMEVPSSLTVTTLATTHMTKPEVHKAEPQTTQV